MQRSSEGDMQEDIDTVEGDEQHAFDAPDPTSSEEESCQPRHPYQIGPVEAHDKRVRLDGDEQGDQAEVEHRK